MQNETRMCKLGNNGTIAMTTSLDDEQGHLQAIHSFENMPWMTIEVRKNKHNILGIFAGHHGNYKTPKQWGDSELLWRQEGWAKIQ